jgi:hypothetical protein
MKKSFRDPTTHVLKAHGFVDANAPGDIAREESDTFALQPGRWKFEAGDWVAIDTAKVDAITANIAAIEAEMNRRAVLKYYDNIKSAALRAGYPGPFHDEGVAFATWMDSCYALAYAVLAEVDAGTRPMPTPEESVAMMPPLVLP